VENDFRQGLYERLISLAEPQYSKKQRAAVPGQVHVFVMHFNFGSFVKSYNENLSFNFSFLTLFYS